MAKFLSMDEVMYGYTSDIDGMEVLPSIHEDQPDMDEQIGRGDEVAPCKVPHENPSKEPSSVSQGNMLELGGDATLPNSITVEECVEFLERILEQHDVLTGSPCHDKTWTKKMLQKIAKELLVLPNANRSIIMNDDEDIMSEWKVYVKELIKELRAVHIGGLHPHDSGLHVLTNTPYALVLEMVAEMVDEMVVD